MKEKAKRNIVFKALLIIGLTVLLLIPTFFINTLVQERMSRQKEAFREISSKWAETQTISGPILSIPYMEYFKDSIGNIHKEKKYIHILPDKLTVNGEVFPEKRYRGIYEIVVYSSKLEIGGIFSGLTAGNPGIAAENILFDQAFVALGITDLRGIEENITLNWNKEKYSFNSGVETSDVIESGINAALKLNKNDSLSTSYSFNLKLNLKGSQYIYFTPVGKETEVTLFSKWSTPSFDGAFLPDTREVTPGGFNAYWKVLHLNRNYPQSWINDKYSLGNSAFGVNLILPVDSYTKTDRSIKYAVLFIALTFLLFFFLELMNNKIIHPLQYILVGFALCLFYILLLSISEHLNYTIAYLIASVMTIGLITWYSNSILHYPKLAGLIAGNLVILYGFIFTIIQLEDYALLMGSVGLFIILAVVMWYSRKIDWTGLGQLPKLME